MWRVHVTIVAMETQQYCPFFIVVGVDVAVNKNQSLRPAATVDEMELLSSHPR
jgi:hypothetical protein